ncbi:MAG: RNA 2',3'-cyclic phosphodiesterase [Deltaproteobacteria bacterium]|nr:RNA 2',3'-cyclic phosphodiesterase [Deltaproteobacteria bacterium]MBI3390723.1 RNA 2',3'-cyclic phosphodiesterase [Deltaproteobacteria bacterium]
MSDAAQIRAFVAVDLAADVRERVVRLKAELAAVRSEARWTRDEGLHATMKFLGSVELSRLSHVRDAVARAAASVAMFAMRVRGLGAFPSLKRPRVVWVGLEADGLGELAGTLERELTPLGFPPEARASQPHLTLGRINGARGWRTLEPILHQHESDDFGDSPVDHVTLYRSDLRPGGAVYTALWTSSLSDSTRGAHHGIR